MAVVSEPPWLNKTSGVAARNGTTSHTISFGFTSTSGSLLVVVVFGAVTHAATGWTERLQPVSSGELSVFTKTSAADTSITVTHNGSNYPVCWTAYEFAAGSTWVAGTGSQPTSDTFPNLTGLPGAEVVVFGGRGRTTASGAETAADTTWTAPWVEDADQFAAVSGTDGCMLAVGHQINVTSTSLTPSASTSYSGAWTTADREHVTYALTVASGTTTVTKGVATSWDTASVVTKAPATTWQVAGVVTKTVATGWDAASTATKAVASTWATAAVVSKAPATSWDVLGQVSASRATTWDTAGQAVKSVATTWQTAATVAKDAASTWNVAAVVTDPTSTSWAVAQTVTAAPATTWSVYVTVTDPMACTWQTAAEASRSAATSWATAAEVTSSTTTSWDVQAYGQVAATVATGWDVASPATVSTATGWSVSSTATLSTATVWAVAAVVARTVSTGWDLDALPAVIVTPGRMAVRSTDPTARILDPTPPIARVTGAEQRMAVM